MKWCALVLRKSSKRAGRVVRYTLADGTVTTKRYAPYKPKAKPAGKTVGDLLAAWEMSPTWDKLAENTKKQYSTYSRYLLKIQSAPVKKVERGSLLDLRDAVAKGRGNGAGIAFARTTSAAFGWAVARGWIEHSPATKLHSEIEHKHLPAWTEEDVILALATLSEHLRRAVILALYTGQRRGDLIGMQWSAYDGAKIRVIPEKTKRHTDSQTLVIPAPPELRAELDAWRPEPAKGPILTTKFGNPWRQGSNLSKQLGDALSKVEGFPPHRNIHGLRKLAAARLAQAGCTLHEIAAITGHQSLGMLQLYTRSVDQERAAESATEKLERRKEFVGKIQDLTKLTKPR
jgi:integrase